MTDAAEFGNRHPAYAADITGETRKALDALRADPLHRGRYESSVAAMVYGERAEFDAAIETVADILQVWVTAGSAGAA